MSTFLSSLSNSEILGQMLRFCIEKSQVVEFQERTSFIRCFTGLVSILTPHGLKRGQVSKYLQVYRWLLSKASCKEQTQKLINFGWENWRRETHGLQFLLNVVGVFHRRKYFCGQIRLGKPWLAEVTCVLSLQDFAIPLLCLYPTREEVSMQHFRFSTWILSLQSVSGSRIPQVVFLDLWSMVTHLVWSPPLRPFNQAHGYLISLKTEARLVPILSTPDPLSMQNPLLELTVCSGEFSSAKVTLLLSLFISQIDYVMLCKAYSSIIITTSTQSNMLLNNIPVSK